METIDKERQGLIIERISDFNNTRSVPSPAAGRTIFVRTCAPCHSVGGEGGRIGPHSMEWANGALPH
ncbi:MAG: c-type cytochrome [Chitinophagaceae bacterium]|nr:c-type cytochrome [Chitinophagaceae bacterium]